MILSRTACAIGRSILRRFFFAAERDWQSLPLGSAPRTARRITREALRESVVASFDWDSSRLKPASLRGLLQAAKAMGVGRSTIDRDVGGPKRSKNGPKRSTRELLAQSDQNDWCTPRVPRRALSADFVSRPDIPSWNFFFARGVFDSERPEPK